MIVLFFLTFILIGYGFSILFLPSKLRSNALLFAPWIGIAATIYIGLALNLGKVAMNEELLVGPGFRGFHFIILIVVISTLYAAFYTKRRFLQFKKNHLIILALSLTILGLLEFLPFKNQTSIITSSNYLLEETVTDTLIKAESLSHKDLLIGVPIVVTFFRSVYPAVSVGPLSQIANLYTELIISAGIFICALIFLKKVVTSNSRAIHGSDLLFALFIFALFSINILLAIISLLLLFLYSIYQSYDKKKLLPLYKTSVTGLLILLINPIYTGLLLHLYFQ